MRAAAERVAAAIGPDGVANRLVVTKSDAAMCEYDISQVEGTTPDLRARLGSIFDCRPRDIEDQTIFNAVFLVRFLMGTVGLQPVRASRILTVMDNHPDAELRDATINAVNAALSTYGAYCGSSVLLEPPISLSARYTSAGRASGIVNGNDHLYRLLDERRGTHDAVALATVVKVPLSYHARYFESHGEIINPWGGAEAILTHAISSLFDVLTAHAPITTDREVSNFVVGQVDPRMAAEAMISYTYFQCVLKGLRQSPCIVPASQAGWPAGVLSAANVSCIVMPDKCIGLSTLAALEQGIPVIAVWENRNILENDLTALPWAPGQLLQVENYWEAAGVVAAMRRGLDPRSVRRPLHEMARDIHAAGSIGEMAAAQ